MATEMWLPRNITTQTTTAVFSGACELMTVVVNTGATSAVCVIWDGNANTGQKIATIDASSANTFFYGVVCSRGITVVTSGGNADITVSYVEHDFAWNPYLEQTHA